MKQIVLVLVGAVVVYSCQIKEEIVFNEDGSGTYHMAFDMSELMKMGDQLSDSLPPEPPVDTLINFASFLDSKKDSISKLSKEEQTKLKALRPLQVSMKIDEGKKEMDMQMRYAFKNLDDISKFAETIKKAEIKELNEIMNPMGGMSPMAVNDSTEKKDGMGELFSISESFETSFSGKRFTRTITEKALSKALSKKDTTLKEDDPFTDMIRFKQVYKFPFKVKSVSNSKARILSDFKGVEIEANMYELNKDPEFFNIEVEFE